MKKLYLIISLFIFYTVIYAQNTETDKLLNKLVEKQILTQKEANEIKEESKKESNLSNKTEQATQKVRNIFNNTPYFELGGYGLLLYQYNSRSEIKESSVPRVVFISAKGKVTDKIGYSILTELANPRLYEFYAEFTPYKELNFKVGQAKVPISIENLISLTNLETIMNTRSISNLIGMSDDVMKKQNGINNTGRDMGIQLYGSTFNISGHDLIQYSAGIFQGSGINTNDKDNSKDFAGTLLFQPIKGFRIGGSVLFGEATYKINDKNMPINHVRNRWMISSDYKSDRFYARAEWIRGKDSSIEKEGLYGTLQYYVLPKKLSLVGKVDYFNKNKDSNVEVVDYLAGVDYYFYSRCRVQINYQYSDFSKKWDSKNSHNILGQLQFVF